MMHGLRQRQKISKISHLFTDEETAESIWDNSYKAVITVPTYLMTHKDRNKRCRKNAGLEVLRIINEPTAASLLQTVKEVKLLFTILVEVHLMYQF